MHQAKGFILTIGKGTGDRNDDFALIQSVSSGCQVGVIGDFTSNSARGVNLRLRDALGAYLKEKTPVWRERLIEPQTIAELTLRFADKWLADRTETARTTMIVMVTDTRAGMLYHLSVGDSGLALIHRGECRFIYLGDTSGVRDASGFLPLGAAGFQVETTPLPKDGVLLAYTDGLWENTQLMQALQPSRRSGFLASLLTGPNLSSMEQGLKNELLAPADRTDDLTLLVLVPNQGSGAFAADPQTLTPSQTDPYLEAMLDRCFSRHIPS